VIREVAFLLSLFFLLCPLLNGGSASAEKKTSESGLGTGKVKNNITIHRIIQHHKNPRNQWPLAPGKIKFSGLPASELNNFAVIPEDKNQLIILPPKNDVVYDADGLWFRPNRNQWFKVPDQCTLDVYLAGNAIYWSMARGCFYIQGGWQPPKDSTKPSKGYPW
jgi:hypothetical protein